MIPAAVLELIPGCAGARPPRAIVRLPGGQGRNEVLRVDTDEGQFVWRRRLPPIDRPGAHPLTELAAHRLAAAASLAPEVLHAAPDGAWLLMPYIPSPPWTEARLCSAQGAERLGRQLARLHGLDRGIDVPPADAREMAAGYVARVHARDPAAARALQPLVRQVDQLSQELALGGERPVLVHGDLMCTNLLGPEPVLVDWEYAQLADPSWDWACVLSYYPLLAAWTDRLLGPAGEDHAQGRHRLLLQQRRFDLLNTLWQRAYPRTS